MRRFVLSLAVIVSGACFAEPWSDRSTILCGELSGLAAPQDARVGYIAIDAGANASTATSNQARFTASNTSGHFELRVPRAVGTVYLIARAPGYAPIRTGRVALDASRKCVGTLRLSRGAVIQGRVIEEWGTAIVGARILAVEPVGSTAPLPNSVLPVSASEQDGYFSLSGLEGAVVDLRIEKSGYAPRVIRAVPLEAARPPLLVRLAPATFLSGSVTNHAGEPVAAAKVSARWDYGSASEAISGKDGRFKLGPFAKGSRVSLTIRAHGYAPSRSDDNVTPNDQMQIVLDRNGTLRGKVFDAQNGDVVKKFRVIFQRQPKVPLLTADYPGSRSFESSQGRFTWQDVYPGSWTIAVDAPGYRVKQLVGVQIPQGGAGADLQVALDRGLMISGHVHDEVSGAPIANAEIREQIFAAPMPAFEIVRSVRTDEKGAFVMSGLPTEPFALRVSATGYLSEERILSATDQATAEFSMSKGGTVIGRLVGDDGITPIQGMVRLENLTAGYGISISTSADGSFEFTKVRNGTYRITGQTSLGLTRPQELSVARNGRSEVALRLISGASIQGQITGLMPGEQRGAQIELVGKAYTKWVSVGDDGHYVLRGIPPGTATVTAKSALHRELSREVELSVENVTTADFHFPRGLRVSGTVRRAGLPVRFAQVVATPTAEQLVHGSAETTSSGQYALEGLSEGRYLIRAGSAAPIEIDLSSNATLNFELPSLVVSGQIADAMSGEPLQGVALALRTPEASEAAESVTVSDYAGHFTLTGLSPGSYQLLGYKKSFERLSRPLSLSDHVKGLTLQMNPDAGVRIRVRDARTGLPLRKVTVYDTGQNYTLGEIDLTLDGDGVGALPSALKGRTLRILAFGYQEFVVPNWSGAVLDVRLRVET